MRQLTGGADAKAPPSAAAGTAAPAPAGSEALPAPPPRHYETIVEWGQLESWLARLRAAPLFAFDTETTSLDYMNAEIVGVSFCIEPGVAAYVPWRTTMPAHPTSCRASGCSRR